MVLASNQNSGSWIFALVLFHRSIAGVVKRKAYSGVLKKLSALRDKGAGTSSLAIAVLTEIRTEPY